MYTCKLYFLWDIQWLEAQSHSDDSHVHANGPYSTRAIAQARPTMSCTHLVLIYFEDSVSVYSTVNEGLQMKDRKSCSNIDLWEWLLVGVAMANKRITDVEPERAVPVALMTTILHD